MSAVSSTDNNRLTQTRVQRALAAVLAAGFGLAFLFVSFPEIDLWISKVFFIEPTIFALTHSEERLAIIGYLRQAGFAITRITMIGLFVLIVVAYFFRRSRFWLNRKKLLYVFFCFALAPGLFVSVILKENWGRARPAHIADFGGKMEYTPPMMRTNQCTGNCSFPSGEASFAFCFLAFGMISRRRPLLIKLALGYGVFFAVLRVGEGGHFTSDVVFSALISLITCLTLYRFMFEGAYGYAQISTWAMKRTPTKLRSLMKDRLSDSDVAEEDAEKNKQHICTTHREINMGADTSHTHRHGKTGADDPISAPKGGK
ncbi:MAG: phosphatase PAP2 family protein [Pseudomonadota bacterium]|nr:phosphatase PAP2 family protein [Pseudomonadota bacterium]